ncbi:MAG: hypothetical protein HY906_05810 [Deltaproteobacteria bacterium]|nr:hypothetical protein [Deltaproteobacteria bacterium]
MNRFVLCAALGVALAAGALACDGNGRGQTLHETEATPLPPIKVDLPPAPPFTPIATPEKYPDGNYSIHGLHKNIEKLIGQKVGVTGFCREVYKCPECPKDPAHPKDPPQCKACQQPHYWLTDEKDGKIEKAMMVVDYPTKKPLVENPPEFTIGNKYRVKGTFQRSTLSGFSASDGLLTHDETKAEDGTLVVEGNTNVAFDVKGTTPGKGDKMRAKVEGTDKEKPKVLPKKGLPPKKKGK